MRFFNPFKPHVAILYNGAFAVRRFTIAGWEFLETGEDRWWSHNMIYTCFYVQPVDAAERCIRYLNKPKFSKLYAY